MILEKSNEIKLQEGINFELLNEARSQKGLTFEKLAALSEVPEATVKNILTGKTKNPRMETLAPICRMLGVPLERVLENQDKNYIENQGIKEGDVPVIALKEIYEYQISAMNEMNEIHINNIRAHYEQHHEDLKENFERRLFDKRELIESYKEHIKNLEKECRTSKIAFWILGLIFISLLIAEVMNPNLGWLRY